MSKSNSASETISLPKGGGALRGLGEKFAPDLQTGTGAFSVPIALPSGRHGVQPELSLVYSSGNGNGVFGLGWSLSLPGISRKTSQGVPRYNEGAPSGDERRDVFILSGAEDLAPISGAYPGRMRYSPRTEGLFARIEHIRDATGNYWEVRSKDGLITRYGSPRPPGVGIDWQDPAITRDPASADTNRVFAWKITETRDPFGNHIRYEYLADQGDEPGHQWNDPHIRRISYGDYGDPAQPSYLVAVEFEYEQRPDPYSNYRAGFEIRASLRCSAIRIVTQTSDGVSRPVSEYRFTYEQSSFNGSSLLARIDVVGFDDQQQAPALGQMPPITFGYTQFEPGKRRFDPITGRGLPAQSFTNPDLALVDLFGSGLPDLLEMGVSPRYWRNLGGGLFDLPQMMKDAPSRTLREQGVQFIDANGDGRTDLLITSGPLAGYFPLSFSGGWNRKSFQPYRFAPSFNLEAPNVKLVDLDGDGLTDVLRSGERLECFFNDPDPARAWRRTAFLPMSALDSSPGIDLSDPRIRFADMNGDGLQDIVRVQSGSISYWPNLGHGRWGKRVQMRRAPRLPDGYDPRRILLGDVDGDGLADFIYVDHGRVLLWANRGGDRWSEEPVAITGTPGVVNTDNLQLADIYGQGTSGLLWARDSDGTGRPHMMFLDFSGGLKPYLLNAMDNHLGAQTRVEYRPSTFYYVQDQRNPKTRWRTPLPIPVQVVARVEVIDEISLGKLTTEYRYHHGYWDGAEREFRGFACVEQFDTETFEDFNAPGLHGPDVDFLNFQGGPGQMQFSPPTLTKSWFHVGPVGEESGDWKELDLRHEFWPGDEPALSRPPEMVGFLGSLPRRVKRDALRALRGRILRTELFALDGTSRQGDPYTVAESLYGVREERPPGTGEDERRHIFFPFPIAQRTTQWERGDDPMTQFAFSGDYDAYGQPRKQVSIAVPRGRDYRVDADSSEPYLSMLAVTEYAQRNDAEHYMVNRVARGANYEALNDGRQSVFKLRDAIFDGTVSLRITGHARSFYDGEAFVGLPLGQLGQFGALVRSESLVFTDDFLKRVFDPADPQAVSQSPVYLNPQGAINWPAEYPDEFKTRLPQLAGYLHYADGDIAGSPGGYYASGARSRYDFQDPDRVARGLALTTRDPLGADSSVVYDAHDLLPVRATDPAGLTTEATYNYRVLKPREVIDANGNIASFEFSPIGLVAAQFLRGKNQEGDGVHPSVRMEYDLRAFIDRRQPAFVRSIRRFHHDSETDVDADERDQTVVSIEYSDGFGRLLQTRTQAEDTLFGDPVFGGGVISPDQSAPNFPTMGRARQPGDPLNVVVSGWQIYDNKGRIVEKFEPFFAQGEDFAPPVDAQLGRKAILFYDPRGQLVRTLNPDGSEQLVVIGAPLDLSDPSNYRPTAWESYTYDANDNAGRTHGDAAAAFRDHWNTPASIVVDALGRTITAVARNGANPETDWHTTRSTYDIQGNLLTVTDALGRVAFRYVYDLAKRGWRSDSIDAGRHDTVLDVMGNLTECRDSKGALILGSYDLLHRPARVWARDSSIGPVTLRQILEYGDEGSPDQSDTNRAATRARNLLGQLVAHHDEAGLTTIDSMDFKGNVLNKSRRVVADAPLLAVYEVARGNGWQVTPFQMDWQPRPGQRPPDREAELLEATAYQTTTSYDALNRIKRMDLPQDVGGRRRTLLPIYNNAGGLEKVFFDDVLYVERIAYDAKGQRALIAYGNGVMTRYAYDAQTFLLKRMRSEHFTHGDIIIRVPPPDPDIDFSSFVREDITEADPGAYFPTGDALQDFGYDYDLAGNILAIFDRAPGSGILNNPDASNVTDPTLAGLLVSGNALIRRFAYDPIYRLRSATGRECDLAPDGPPWLDTPRCADLTRARTYTELYTYDRVGSVLSLQHQNATGGFVRQFTMEASNNRLQVMQIGQSAFAYGFDQSGNMLAETISRHFEWNHSNQMKAFATQIEVEEPSVHAQYLYDAAGQRVKKLVRKQGGQVEVRHYIDGVFEHHRWGSGKSAGQNNHAHVMDDKQRIALVRIGKAHPDDLGPAVQFHLGDHLGGSNVVVDSTGAFVNREEFTPYGETSFGSFAKKRYRFTGKERDEESGLSYHGARYYAPWLSRWGSCDPIGMIAGMNAYTYCEDSPVQYQDPSGLDSETNQLSDEQLIDLSSRDPIYVNGVGLHQYDNLFSAAKRGIIDVNTPAEFERQLNCRIALGTADYLESSAARQAKISESTWREFVDKQYLSYLNGKAYELEQSYRQNDRAFGAVKDILAFELMGLGAAIGVGTAGVVGFAKQLGFGALLAGATSNGGYHGCGMLVSCAPLPRTGPAPLIPSTTGSAKALPELVQLNEFGLPAQIHNLETSIGPAYATGEQAVAAMAEGGHVMEVIVRQRGKVVGNWWEVSESGIGQLGHTEQKALKRIAYLGSDVSIEFRGAFPPCPYSGGCMNTLQLAAQTGASITYRQTNGATIIFQRE